MAFFSRVTFPESCLRTTLPDDERDDEIEASARSAPAPMIQPTPDAASGSRITPPPLTKATKAPARRQVPFFQLKEKNIDTPIRSSGTTTLSQDRELEDNVTYDALEPAKRARLDVDVDVDSLGGITTVVPVQDAPATFAKFATEYNTDPLPPSSSDRHPDFISSLQPKVSQTGGATRSRMTDTQRYEYLAQELWISPGTIDKNKVQCRGCSQWIKLETKRVRQDGPSSENVLDGEKTGKKRKRQDNGRDYAFYPSLWIKHRDKCRAIYTAWCKEQNLDYAVEPTKVKTHKKKEPAVPALPVRRSTRLAPLNNATTS